MTQEMHLILPFAMYSGGAKHILNVDNKRKFIKVTQIQEIILHTIPLGALIWYNNSTDIVYDETLDIVVKIVFCTSLALNLIEIFIYRIYKASGTNIELNKAG